MTATARTDDPPPAYRRPSASALATSAGLSRNFTKDVHPAGTSSSDNYYDARQSRQRQLSFNVAEDLDRQVRILSALRPDWDGYGADPIPRPAVELLLLDLRNALDGIECPSPDLIPGGDGSLQAEWHLRSIQITFGRDPSGNRHCWIRRRLSGFEQEAFQMEALALLKNSARDLAD